MEERSTGKYLYLETFGKVVLMAEECGGRVRQWLIVARNNAFGSVDDISHLPYALESRTYAKARQDHGCRGSKQQSLIYKKVILSQILP
jgi:hypothetical protein